MASVIPALTEPASLESFSQEAETREIQLCNKADGENPLPKTLAFMHGPWYQHALPHDNVNKNIKENDPSNCCGVISELTAFFVFLQTGFRCQEPASCFDFGVVFRGMGTHRSFSHSLAKGQLECF